MWFSKLSHQLPFLSTRGRRLIASAAAKLQVLPWMLASVLKQGRQDHSKPTTFPVVPFGNGEIRVLSEAGKSLFREHLMRLDPETRRSRFAMHATDTFLTGYAETSFSLNTLIFAYFEDGLVRATAELRSLDDFELAEAAFCVEKDWRRNGLASALMTSLLKSARSRDVRHIYINCLASNRHMQALARKFSAEMTFEAGDVIGRLVPLQEDAPSWLSQLSDRLLPQRAATSA